MESSYLQGIVVGLAIGFLANWVFAIAMRLLPDTWARYGVQIEGMCESEDLPSMKQCWALVRILPPSSLRRIILKEPLKEYLGVDLRLDDQPWRRTKWEWGDTNELRFRADGAGVVNALVYTIANNNACLVDDVSAISAIQEGTHTLQIRVRRLLDDTVAAERRVPLAIDAKGTVTVQTMC